MKRHLIRTKMMILVGVVLLVFAGGAAGLTLRAYAFQTVTIGYTASIDGHLDGCSCWGAPVGGVVKLAAGLRGDAADARPDILVDTGNALPPGSEPALSRYILDTYEQLEYDVVAIGDQETSDGVEALISYLETYPVATHNVRVQGGPDPLSVPIERTINDVVVGVISITGREALAAYPAEVRSLFEIGGVDTTLRRILSEHGDWYDLLIVVYHGTYEKAKQIGRTFPSITAIVFGREELPVEERLNNGVTLVSPGRDGTYLGSLSIVTRRKRRTGAVTVTRIAIGRRYFDYNNDPDDPEVREYIDAYEAMREELLQARVEKTKF
mgnify:CR=1 FL=1